VDPRADGRCVEPLPCRDGEAGLWALQHGGGERLPRGVREQLLAVSGEDERRDLLQQDVVDQRDAHFERVCHGAPVEVAQELVAQEVGRFEGGDARVCVSRIGRDRLPEARQEAEPFHSFARHVVAEELGELVGEEEAALEEVGPFVRMPKQRQES